MPWPAPGESAIATIAGRTFPISRELLDDLEGHDLATTVAGLDRPLLVLHPVDDEVVPVTEGERIFSWSAQPKSFVPLLGTDHLLTDRGAAARALEVVVGWFDATLR